VLNVSALWLFYVRLWRGISSRELRYCAAAFTTLVPFRVVHSIVIAADAFTVQVFALAALFTLRLFDNPRRIRSWIGLSLCLTAAMFCKYSFSGMLPPVVLLLGFAIMTRLGKGERLRWCVFGALSLALPSRRSCSK
jgi:4-amino-4-deoxy-L-arabinose transferase-like glycosyltransferase